MPPWVAFVPRSTSLLKGRGIERLPLALHCRNTAIPLISRLPHLRIRSASTLVSPTAINVRPNIPPRNEELHSTLSVLISAAESFVNLSRLQLALRGVAAQDAITRVAVLSLSSQINAQQLARLLLADPLGLEGQWERELVTSGDEGRPVLLRYGEETDTHPPSPLYKILSVPSRVLQTHNLEILVSTLNVQTPTASSTAESSMDALLVPILPVASGSRSLVPYPVHKTLVLGEGLESAVAYGRFTYDVPEGMPDMVKVAVELPPPLKEMDAINPSTSLAVNIETGTTALASFRISIANSDTYEHGWYRSGMPALSEWLVQGLKPSDTLKPTVKDLVRSIVDEAEKKITTADTAQLNHLAASMLHSDVTGSILGHLESWAERSHTELRDELDEAFNARNWHKLAWWKLLWRVDDVGMITSEILERRWLVNAEKSSIYLAGRMDQAGFPDDVRKLAIPLEEEPSSPDLPPPSTVSESPPEVNATDLSTAVRTPKPWPDLIAASRADLARFTVPHLQSLSQRLILQTLSTTSISSALSALLYVSVPTSSVFEAGAIAALGLIFSLRRLQRVWEKARETWQVEIREDGRRTLQATEDTVRLIVRRTQRPVMEVEGVKERKAARDAVRKVRDALAKI